MSDDFDPYYHWLGIPPKDQPPSHYRLLGVEAFESNRDVIEHAADRQMLHVRTFATSRHAEASQRLLNELAAAKLCLLSESKKREYDARLRAKEPVASPALAPLPQAAPVAAPRALPVARPSPPAWAAPVADQAAETLSTFAASFPVPSPPSPSAAAPAWSVPPAWSSPPAGPVARRVPKVLPLALVGGGLALALLLALVAWLSLGDDDERAGTTAGEVASDTPPSGASDIAPAAQHTADEDAVAAPAELETVGPADAQHPPAAPEATPAERLVDLTDEGVDLLALVDPQRDARDGGWRRDGTDLVIESGFNCRLVLPGAPPEEYTLRVEVTPEIHQPQSAFLVLVPVVQGRQVMVAFDWGGQTGLHYLDGQNRAFNETTRAAQALTEGEPAVLELEVTGDTVRVRRDGELLAEWRGSVERFSLLHWAVPETDHMLLGAHGGQYRFTRVSIHRHQE
jgi:hypothetical protein